MRARLFALATILAAGSTLTACSPAEPETPPVWSQPIQQPDVQADPDPIYGDQQRNARGNLAKQLGQPGAITNQDRSIMVDFTVTNIQPAECGKSAQQKGYSPENGRFLLVDLAANTYDDPAGMLPAVSFGQGWEFVAASDGTSLDAITSAAWNCGYRTIDPTPQLKPNRKYTMQVIVDVPDVPGVATWTTGWSAGGWEWAVPPANS